MLKIGITGHQEMPRAAYDYAAKSIEYELAKHAVYEGVSNLAVGADQLFANIVLTSGNKLHTIIPCKNYEETIQEKDLGEYRKLLSNSSSIETLDFDKPTKEAFFAAGKRLVEYADILLAVWDGEESKGLGGTADIVTYAESIKKPVHIFWPKGMKRN